MSRPRPALDKTNYPCYRVKLWWDDSVDDPHYRLGWKETGITPRERYIVLPFDTPNQDVYNRAIQFAAWVNIQADLHFRMEFNRNYVYNDITHAKRHHYMYVRPADYARQGYADNQQTAAQVEEARNNWAEEYERQQEAKKKAAELLATLTDKEYVRNVDAGYPFYFSPEVGRTYIIDPQYKNVIRLDEAHPVGLCIYLADPSVQQNTHDWAVAIYLYLKGAHKHLHKTANEYRYFRHAQWKREEVQLSSIHTTVGGESEGLVS